jgi:hypothetical protein
MMTVNDIFHIQQILEETGYTKNQTHKAHNPYSSAFGCSPSLEGGGDNIVVLWHGYINHNITVPTTSVLNSFRILKKLQG